jgi:hypothetical protein
MQRWKDVLSARCPYVLDHKILTDDLELNGAEHLPRVYLDAIVPHLLRQVGKALSECDRTCQRRHPELLLWRS